MLKLQIDSDDFVISKIPALDKLIEQIDGAEEFQVTVILSGPPPKPSKAKSSFFSFGIDGRRKRIAKKSLPKLRSLAEQAKSEEVTFSYGFRPISAKVTGCTIMRVTEDGVSVEEHPVDSDEDALSTQSI